MYALDFTLRLTVYRLMQQVTIKAQISRFKSHCPALFDNDLNIK